MHFETIHYSVDLSFAKTNLLGIKKGQVYNEIYNIASLHDVDLTKTLLVDISYELHHKRIAFISSGYSSDEDFAVLNNDVLTVLQDDIIIQIDMVHRCVMQHKEFDTFGTWFHIYHFDDGFIVHGEVEIVRLNKHLEVVWVFSGADIFVTNGPQEAFRMCDDRIKLYDFCGNYYEVNYDGGLLSSRMV